MAGKAAHGWGNTHPHCPCVVGVFILHFAPLGLGVNAPEYRRGLVSGALMSSTAVTSGWEARAGAEEGQEPSRGGERTSQAAWRMRSFSEQPFEIEQE